MARTKKMDILTFTLPKKEKLKLQKLERYTLYIQSVVLSSLGVCPVCHSKWKNKKGNKHK